MYQFLVSKGGRDAGMMFPLSVGPFGKASGGMLFNRPKAIVLALKAGRLFSTSYPEPEVKTPKAKEIVEARARSVACGSEDLNR